jgi:hypothetical protein
MDGAYNAETGPEAESLAVSLVVAPQASFAVTQQMAVSDVLSTQSPGNHSKVVCFSREETAKACPGGMEASC